MCARLSEKYASNRHGGVLELCDFMSGKKNDHPFVIFQNAFPVSVIGPMVVQVAVINIVLILGGVFLGIFLDRQLGSKPALTIGLGLLGAIVAGLLTFWSAMRTVRRARAAYMSYAEAKQAQPVPQKSSAEAQHAQVVS
jgi:F0F1-type ATP synthase assembly protein I